MPPTPDENIDWGALDELSDADLGTLADVAINVLQDAANDSDEPLDNDPLQLPREVLHTELRTALAEAGITVNGPVAEDPPTSRAVTLALLSQLAEVPGLRAEIEQAYAQRREMMIVDFGLITGPALLYLVMKLKRVKLDKHGVDVQFYEYREGMADSVRDIIKGP